MSGLLGLLFTIFEGGGASPRDHPGPGDGVGVREGRKGWSVRAGMQWELKEQDGFID